MTSVNNVFNKIILNQNDITANKTSESSDVINVDIQEVIKEYQNGTLGIEELKNLTPFPTPRNKKKCIFVDETQKNSPKGYGNTTEEVQSHCQGYLVREPHGTTHIQCVARGKPLRRLHA